MATKTGIDTVPTKPQADLLIAALDAENHRIPSTATGRTLDIMLRRQWVKEYTANGRLASTVRDYPGFTHFRLTHHGVNAAKKARAARAAAAERGPATLDVEGIGWTCVEAGRKWATEYEGVKFELERRTANALDGCPDTGWYLYGGSHFGEYMGARFKAAAVEAFPYVCPKDGHPQPETEIKDSSQLAEGDIVREHGMRVRLDKLTTVERQGLTVYHWAGTVLNMPEVREAKHVPLSFLRTQKWEPGQGWVTDREDYWAVQGNKLATWAVEVPTDAPAPA
ncbi:hypothetical protein [Streptomyces cahuitamycinicus]|uniref:Uncharacterized protein n=1 Tax=Streptomyces cahuitamycinicus TaxID=2070367 RepID=A0A2N8TDB2_9ACTN|nr:hypothetical protein [Streptomyces cahuitamycinicus]PNG17016.1 hypothetical protein C1J00_38830 [Streptomyces cahuitamycinicus]